MFRIIHDSNRVVAERAVLLAHFLLPAACCLLPAAPPPSVPDFSVPTPRPCRLCRVVVVLHRRSAVESVGAAAAPPGKGDAGSFRRGDSGLTGTA